MTTDVAARCCSLASTQRGHVDPMTSSSSPPTSGHDDDVENSDTTSSGHHQQQKEQRLSFGINQILQCDDDRRPARGVISGDATTASTMALIRSAFGNYVSAQGPPIAGVPGLMVGGPAGGLYGGSSGVIRVPAQRLAAGVCVGQPPPASAVAACRLSAMMFPWMRERKDGLTCTYLMALLTGVFKGAITSKIEHAIKNKTRWAGQSPT